MNKQNNNSTLKCRYCKGQADGIIYRPKDELENIFSCSSHATNLFIPFKDSSVNKNALEMTRFQSPSKKSFHSNSFISQRKGEQPNPQIFFDKLMENIIGQFNTMKKQVINNYNAANNLQRNEQSLKFRMEGDQAYPYMIINNDNDMLMSTFVNRLVGKYSEHIETQKRERIARRRVELSALISKSNVYSSRLQNTKQANSVMLSRSIQGSPQKCKNMFAVQRHLEQTQRKALMLRDYSKTQKRPLKRQE